MKKKFFFPDSYESGIRQIMRIMKLTTLCLLLTVLSLSAANSYSQQLKLNLNLRDASIIEVFNEIEEQSELGFLFNNDQLDLKQKHTIKVSNASISEVMGMLLGGSPLSYKMIERNIIITQDNGALNQQEGRNVTGVVTDEEGFPLPGVSIIVKGTTTGTISDVNGKFSLDVPANSKALVFSFIGMETQEVKWNGRGVMNIELRTSTIGLDEVVAIGYGVKKKVNLTGSVATVDTKIIEDRPTENLLKSLQGTIPGVTIISRPGSTSINIRGRGNLKASEPLYIVDGIEVSSDFFQNIEPGAIKDISFLKDASSAAIYGSKAAYGVVLVTTKEGEKGQLKIDYNGTFGFQKPTYIPDVLNSWEYAEMYRTSELNSGSTEDGLRFSADDVEQYRLGSNPDLYPNTNWFDEVLDEQAAFTKHSLYLSGGGEKVNYIFGLGYMNDESLTPGENNERFNFSSKTKADLKDWLEVTSNINFIYKKYKREQGAAALTEFLRVPPTQVARHTNGEWGSVRNARKATAAEINANPLRTLEEDGRANTDTKHFLGTMNAVIKPFKNVRINNQVGYRYWDYRHFSFKSKKDGVPNHLNPSDGIISGTASEVNQMNMDWRYSEKLIYDGWINYDNTFEGVHGVGLMAGMHADTYTSKRLKVGRKNFGSNDMNAISGGSTDPDDQITTNKVDGNFALGDDFLEESTLSYFGRATYDYKQRYLFEVNFRADASSRFAKEGRWGFFPSSSVGWRVNEEQFLSHVNWIDNLKLRASWGQNGNINNIGLYDTYSTFASGGTGYIGGGVVPVLVEDRIANENLTWETTSTTDIGVDFMVLNGMFSVTADYYNRLTEDILIRANDIAVETGIGKESIPARNVGEVRNRGFEFAVNHNNQVGEVSYSVGFNASKNKNEIVNLGDNVNQLPPDGYFVLRKGESIGSFFMYEADGLYSTDDVANGNVVPYGKQVPEAGMVKFVDQLTEDTDGDGIPDAADGVINEKDRTIVANDVPDFTYGVNLDVSYKNFTLSAIGQGITGVKVYMDNEASQAFFNSSVPREWQLNNWTEENQGAHYPKLFKETDDRYKYNSIASSYWLFNASYFRVKNITLSYKIPQQLVTRAGLQKAKVYISGDNLFTIRGDQRMKDFDPERSSGRGAQIGMKTFTAGVSITF